MALRQAYFLSGFEPGSKVTEERNILLAIKQRKAKWTRHPAWEITSKHVIQGMMEVTKRRERRRKQLLDNVKETRRYWK